ncbi:MAG TPA: CDP-alcohol phosphatidyltransferase family protein [Anaerolineales bacterium]|nr:CDP-alcohol phosphatidyltransferase family protein [Anaerolineales bacterium]
MFDQPLRRAKDRLLTPLARPLRNISPISISLLGGLCGLACAWLAYENALVGSLGLWLANRALDGLDGLVARTHGKQSDFGGYLDILLDFLVYATIPIALTLAQPSPLAYLALAILLASFYVNAASWMYLSALLEKRNLHHAQTQTSIEMPAGIIGGSETVLAYSLFLLLPTHLPSLYGIFSMLVALTILQRLWWAKRNL